jgi:hypothetical protein
LKTILNQKKKLKQQKKKKIPAPLNWKALKKKLKKKKSVPMTFHFNYFILI